jgi:hypothetical protein
MSGTLLPPGNYAIRTLVVGGAFPDGGVLVQRWATPFSPELMACTAAKALDVCIPKVLTDVPAGAWLTMTVEHRPGSFEGRALNVQKRIDSALDQTGIVDLIGTELPAAIELIARAMTQCIGVPAAAFLASADQRPEKLN